MKYQFKTNINCGGCIAAVTPYLNSNNEIKYWEVDTQNPQKVPTVETDKLTDEMIREIFTKAGYKAENLNQQKIVKGRARFLPCSLRVAILSFRCESQKFFFGNYLKLSL